MKAKFNKNHLIIMSLGNIIGSGIFLGSSTVILNAGPAAVFAYLFGGILMAIEITFVTEMSILNPAPGAFRVHATEIFGPWIGFVNGWMFWLSGVLGMASEVAAAAIFTHYWLTGIPLWVFCVIYTVIMTFINFNDLHNLSKIESVLASVKVIALFLFVILGILILFKIVPIEHQVNPFSSPFRSRLAVPTQAVSKDAYRKRDSAEHVPQRKLSRQCGNGKFLWLTQK